MFVVQPVTTYEIRHLTPGTPVKAVLRLFCGEGWLVTYQFSSSPAAANSLNLPGKNIFVFEHIDAFARFTDLVRNEKPISVSIGTTSPFRVFLFTGNEPVGEGE